jgi:hypothetical protein
MLALFARELAETPAGRHTAVAIAGVSDVLRRAAYEQLHPSRVVLRRAAVPFLLSFGVLTALLLTNSALRWSGASPRVLLLALPFTAAFTVPMAVFLTALWVARGARREQEGPVIPPAVTRGVVALATIVALGTLGLAAEIVPRANAQLASWRAGRPVPRVDRSMTLTELRAAAAAVRESAMISPRAAREARASYEVEIHKKFVIAASCLVLALAGCAVGWRMPQRGLLVLLLSSVVVCSAFVVGLQAAEAAADRLVVPPAVAMWSVNAVGLLLALAGWPRASSRARRA